nr:hypothetical protein HUO10_003883 [Paraburkholderia busanensis]
MKRRTFMMSSVWFPVAPERNAWPWRRPASRGALAIADMTLPQGRAFARSMRRLGVPVLDLSGDIGALWYSTLAPLLHETETASASAISAPDMRPILLGCTRDSDHFVLAHLAACAGYRVVSNDNAGTTPAGAGHTAIRTYTPCSSDRRSNRRRSSA